MPIELPLGWVIALNVLGWPVIQLGIAWIFLRLPDRLFDRSCSSPRSKGPTTLWYDRVLHIRRWKQLLPDGAPWLGGFTKRRLGSSEPRYLRQFIRETRRGETAHWLMMLAGTIFLLWNPPWADAVMIGYALAANLPCILTQRYNRIRMKALLHRSSTAPDRAE